MIPNSILQMITKINPKLQGLRDIKTPDEMAQLLLNNGIVNQEHVNKSKEMWNQPDIRQMIQNRYKY